MIVKYITCYYNYSEGFSRYKLTRDFMNKYGDMVHMIEFAYEDAPFLFKGTRIRLSKFTGFMNNKAINYYIKNNKLDAVVFIDSDLILEEEFFDKLESQLVFDLPTYCQPFSVCYEKHKNPKIISPPMQSSSMSFTTLGRSCENNHTGYIYAYNKKFLQLINYHFPESLVLGGFDTVLWECINGTLQEDTYDNDVYKFNYQIQMAGIQCIEGIILHNEHGNKGNRYSGRMELYKKPITEEVLLAYFERRADA